MTVLGKPMSEKEKYLSFRVAADVVQMAKTIVAVRGGTISDLISDICRPVLAKKIEQLIKENAFLPKPEK